MPLTSEIIRRIVEAFPDESDETIKAIAKVQGLAGRAWDWGNKPLANFGSETTQNPIGKFALQMAEGMTSPLGLGSLALSGGAALAGKAGALGLSRAGLIGEAALNAPTIAHGAYTAGTADTMGGKAAGLLEASLGTLGTAGPSRALRRMNKSLEQVPEMLEKARVHGGVSMDPDLGDLGGQPGWAVGGMIAPEGKGTTALADLPNEEFRQYIMNNARAMGKKNQFPGVWQDPDTGKAAMDITTRLFNPQQATREGILAGQKAIFDLGSFTERPTMGLPVRTRTAILKGGPESLEAYGSPTRFGSMLGLQPGELRGLAQGGDQDALSALLRLAQDETGAIGGTGRTIKPTRSQPPRSLRRYVHGGSADMNTALRQGETLPPHLARRAGELDAMLEDIPEGELLQRVSDLSDELARLKPGDRFSDPGFTSTTRDVDALIRGPFGEQLQMSPNQRMLMEFEVGPGVRGIDVNRQMGPRHRFADQQEVVLGRNQPWEVSDVGTVEDAGLLGEGARRIRFRPPTTAAAAAVPGLMLNTAEAGGFVDEETRNSDWYKIAKVLGDLGMLGGVAGTLGPNAKRQLDWFEQAAKSHPTLKPPAMKALRGTMERGYFRGRGGADRGFQLREGAIPDFKQNTRYNLDQVLKVSPKRGAYFAPHIEKRIDKILKFVDDAGLDPASIDWTNPEWMKAFNTPHDAQVFAKLVGSLSPRKELLPNMRDAISVVLQDRMGIPTTQMAAPFGRRGTGFGFGFGYAPEGSTLKNLAKALKNEPIGTLYPNKVNELAEGPLGNMSALPWDMHWARGLGLKSDITGSELEYALMKMAGEDAMKARGFQGAFPGMAKLWTGEKMAVAGHEPGMVEYIRRLQTKMPELFRGYTPRNEADFFNTLADVQQAMGGKLSKDQMEAIRSVTAGRLFF